MTWVKWGTVSLSLNPPQVAVRRETHGGAIGADDVDDCVHDLKQ